MQNIILTVALLILTSVATHAQCDKKVAWHANKGELIDINGQVVDTKEEEFSVTISKTEINIEVKNQPGDAISGVVKETNCNWQQAYKNGKTVIKAEMKKSSNGETSPATLTIEGKDGTITILVEIEKMEGRKFRLLIDKYEES
jgi:hypothetical protein